MDSWTAGQTAQFLFFSTKVGWIAHFPPFFNPTSQFFSESVCQVLVCFQTRSRFLSKWSEIRAIYFCVSFGVESSKLKVLCKQHFIPLKYCYKYPPSQTRTNHRQTLPADDVRLLDNAQMAVLHRFIRIANNVAH